MSTRIRATIDRVPRNVPNRAALAALLETVEAALADIAKDDRSAEYHRRIYNIATLLWLLECCTPKSDVFFRVREELTRATDATYAFAKRHKIPSGWGHIMREARAVLNAVR